MIFFFGIGVALSFALGASFGVWIYPYWLGWALARGRLARSYFLKYRTLPMIQHLEQEGPVCPTCGWIVHKGEELVTKS